MSTPRRFVNRCRTNGWRRARVRYRELFETTFGPVIDIRASLAGDPERRSAFDREFREFTIRGNQGSRGGPAEYPFDYLLVVARRR